MRNWRTSAWVCVTLLLGACSTPQPLILPWPGATHGTSAIATASTRAGVPLESQPHPDATEPRVLVGSGELTGSGEPRRAPPQPSAGDAVTLNLSGASIPAAAKAVLGDALGVNYSVSEKVKGSVTLQTPKPVSRQHLAEMFEATLKAEGAGIIVANGLHRIVPLEEATAAGAQLRPAGAAGRGGVGQVSQVVQMRHVAAADMERLLKSVVPQGGAARADAARNVVILTGTRAEIDALIEAVSIFDVDQMRGMSFGLFPLESSDPDAVAQELDVLFGNDKETATRGIVRFVPNKRLKAILVIAQRPEHLRRADGWIRKLDIVGKGTEKQVHVYHVQNRPAAELATLLRRVYQSQMQDQERGRGPGSPSATPSPSDVPTLPPAPTVVAAPGPDGLPALPRLPPALAGTTAADPARADDPANAARAANVQPAGSDDRSAGIGIVADEANNALVVTATAAEYKRIRQILTRIDVAPNQLLLEATIAEVTLNDELKLGLRWFFESGKRSQFRLTDSPFGVVAPAFPGFSYFLNAPNVQVALKALSSVTDVNVVSSPTLMVIDNKKAVLQIGDEVPIATQSAVSVLTPGAPIVNSIQFRNTGIILGITPRISDRGRILLDIEQEVSEVVKTTTSTIDSPTIQQRRVRTTVAVNDGESLILAGLMQDKASRERDQVPILGDIPILGNMVKNKTDTIKRTELLIAMTPRIVRDANQARNAIDEFRAKLNFSTRPQRQGPPDQREQLERLAR